MPYVYMPPLERRILRFLKFMRWCTSCNNWVGLMHLHHHDGSGEKKHYV